MLTATAAAKLLIFDSSCSFSLDLRLMRLRGTVTGDSAKHFVIIGLNRCLIVT